MCGTTLRLTLFLILVFSMSPVKSAENTTYQSYQGSITCSTKFSPAYPSTIEEIQKLNYDSLQTKVKLKPVGSKHSISDSICTEGIPVYLTKIQHFFYNSSTQTVTVGAGMQLLDFLDKLNVYNRTVPSPPAYGAITIGGAIANGAHGTGFNNPSLCESMVSLTIVDGQGNIKNITKDHQDFPAVSVNLGLFGIVYQAEFATVPQYKLSIKQYPVDQNILFNITELTSRAKKFDHFQLFWFPTNNKVVLSEGTAVSLETPGNCSTTMVVSVPCTVSQAFSLAIEAFQATRYHVGMFQMQTYFMFAYYRDVKGTQPFFIKEDGTSCMKDPVGLSYKMKLNNCNPCYWDGGEHVLRATDSEIMVPIEKLSEALKELQKLFEIRLVNFAIVGIWVRFVSPGKSLMGINKGGNGWATIEWIMPVRWDRSEPQLGIAALQAMGKTLTKTFGGRPHWGKNGLLFSEADLIKEVHGPEDVTSFLNLRSQYDPDNLFMNTFGERISGTDNALKVEPKLSKKCALNEVCECKKDENCGYDRFLSLDYGCRPFSDSTRYPVCSPTFVEQVAEVQFRKTIAGLNYTEVSIAEALMKYPPLKDLFT